MIPYSYSYQSNYLILIFFYHMLMLCSSLSCRLLETLQMSAFGVSGAGTRPSSLFQINPETLGKPSKSCTDNSVCFHTYVWEVYRQNRVHSPSTRKLDR